jgi:hypothetical protein
MGLRRPLTLPQIFSAVLEVAEVAEVFPLGALLKPEALGLFSAQPVLEEVLLGVDQAVVPGHFLLFSSELGLGVVVVGAVAIPRLVVVRVLMGKQVAVEVVGARRGTVARVGKAAVAVMGE